MWDTMEDIGLSCWITAYNSDNSVAELEDIKAKSVLHKGFHLKDCHSMILISLCLSGPYSPQHNGPPRHTHGHRFMVLSVYSEVSVTMFGMSRKYNQYVIDWSKSAKGNGGFSEQFMPSVAMNEDVNAVSISLVSWSENHPLHCVHASSNSNLWRLV